MNPTNLSTTAAGAAITGGHRARLLRLRKIRVRPMRAVACRRFLATLDLPPFGGYSSGATSLETASLILPMIGRRYTSL